MDETVVAVSSRRRAGECGLRVVLIEPARRRAAAPTGLGRAATCRLRRARVRPRGAAVPIRSLAGWLLTARRPETSVLRGAVRDYTRLTEVAAALGVPRCGRSATASASPAGWRCWPRWLVAGVPTFVRMEGRCLGSAVALRNQAARASSRHVHRVSLTHGLRFVPDLGSRRSTLRRPAGSHRAVRPRGSRSQSLHAQQPTTASADTGAPKSTHGVPLQMSGRPSLE